MMQSKEYLAELRERLPYRPCAGVVLFNREGKVWLGHRLMNTESNGADNMWQLPQGGIDNGEDRQDAATREMWEETGVTNAKMIAEIRGWVTYDLPDSILGKGLKGKYRGQKQAWFAYLFEGDESEINISNPPDGTPVEFDKWHWVNLETIAETIVAFKRDVYVQLIEEFADLPDRIRSGEFS